MSVNATEWWERCFPACDLFKNKTNLEIKMCFLDNFETEPFLFLSGKLDQKGSEEVGQDGSLCKEGYFKTMGALISCNFMESIRYYT